MKIVCMNIKGGTGKTTSALLLGAVFAEANSKYRVALLDLDRQESGREYVRQLGVSNFSEHDKNADYDLVIVDTPPYMSDDTEKHLKDADLVVVVLSPSLTDVTATKETERILRELKRDKAARLLFNRVETNTRLFSLLDDMKKMFKIKPFENFLPKRTSYAVALGEGYRSIPGKDRSPLKDVAMEILTHIR